MDTRPNPETVLRFGLFEADLHSGELRRSGARVRIQEQPFHLLEILLERPGRLVTRQELQERLWAGDTFVGFEDGLNTAIKKLREALGDDPSDPKYVETVPRRGYRFIADVQTIELHPAPATLNHTTIPSVPAIVAVPEQRERSQGTRQLRHWAIATVAVGTVALTAFAFWWSTPVPPPSVLRISPTTSSGRLDFIAKPATDGTRIFYLERQGDHWDLMQTSVKGGEAQRISTPFRNARVLDVSPDRAKLLIGSFDARGADMQIWLMPAQGGSPTRLGDLVATDALWTPDGKHIVYTYGPDIIEADADGANKRIFASVPGAKLWFSWSPDGRKLRFTRTDLDKSSSSIWEIDSDGANLHRVSLRQGPNISECCGSWVENGRYFAFSSPKDGMTSLWVNREMPTSWRRSASGPFQLTSGPIPFDGAIAGADGKTIYSYGGHSQGDMEVFNPQTGKFSPFLPDTHVMHVAFSSDAQWIAYVDYTDGTLMKSHPDGSGRVQLTQSPFDVTFPAWSPDGQSISFMAQDPSGNMMVYRVSADGGTPQPVDPGKTDVRDASWSPDGKQFALAHTIPPGNPPSARYAIFLVNWNAKQERAVPGSEGMLGPRWSPDGRFLAAVKEDQRELRLYDFKSQQWRTVAHGTALGIPSWSHDGRYIYFQDLLGGGEAIQRFRVSDSSIERVVEFSNYLNSGITRCAFLGLNATDAIMVSFGRSYSDLYGLDLSLP